MTGGGIKSLIPGHCSLSLPTFVEGSDYRVGLPRSQVVTETAFRCAEGRLVVAVLEREARDRVRPG